MSDSGRPGSFDLSKHMQKLDALPVFSASIREVLHTTDSSQASFEQIADLIQRDPALSLHVLRSANSLLSTFEGKVTGVLHAVRILGFVPLRGVVVSRILLDKARRHPGVSELWYHSQAVSVICTVIGRYMNSRKVEELQTIGLLHDIGKFFFYDEYSEYYEQEFQLGDSQRAEPDWLRERDIFGIDHCLLGDRIVRNFHLPRILFEPILVHHDPSKAVEFPELAHTCAVADGIARAFGSGVPEYVFVEPEFTGSLDVLGLGTNDLRNLLPEVLRRLSAIELLLP